MLVRNGEAETSDVERAAATGRLGLAALLLALTGLMPLGASSSEAGAGAAIGGFIGLVLGYDVGDVIAGAAIGAVGGAIAGSASRDHAADYDDVDYELQDISDDLAQKQARQSELVEQRSRLQEERARLEAEQIRLQAGGSAGVVDAGGADATAMPAAVGDSAEPSTQTVDAVDAAEAIGADNLSGFQALVRCEHAQAIRLSRTGRLSDNGDHRLASLWLEALIGADAGAEPSLERVIDADPDISSEAEARAALNEVAGMIGAERRASGISCG